MSRGSRTVLAGKIAVNRFALLVVSIRIGTDVLTLFGISLPVVEVGLVLTAAGWGLFTGRRLLVAARRAGNTERLYDHEMELLEAVRFDMELAGAELLGRDVARVCSPEAFN